MPKQEKNNKGLENIIEEKPQEKGLEQKVVQAPQPEDKLDKPSKWYKVAFDLLKYSPVVAAQFALLGSTMVLSTAIPAIGFSIGAYIRNKKNKVKTTWNRLKKELYTGNIVGLGDYTFFSIPDKLKLIFPFLKGPGIGIGILNTLLANPLLVVPYNMLYLGFTYLRDHIGLKKLVKGVFTGKIFQHAKDTYKKGIKPTLWQDTKSIFKFLFPLHYIQINHIPSVPLRMLQSVLVNNPVYRLLMGGKGKDKKYEKYSKKEKIPKKYAQKQYLQQPAPTYG